MTADSISLEDALLWWEPIIRDAIISADPALAGAEIWLISIIEWKGLDSEGEHRWSAKLVPGQHWCAVYGGEPVKTGLRTARAAIEAAVDGEQLRKGASAGGHSSYAIQIGRVPDLDRILDQRCCPEDPGPTNKAADIPRG